MVTFGRTLVTVTEVASPVLNSPSETSTSAFHVPSSVHVSEVASAPGAENSHAAPESTADVASEVHAAVSVSSSGSSAVADSATGEPSTTVVSAPASTVGALFGGASENSYA